MPWSLQRQGLGDIKVLNRTESPEINISIKITGTMYEDKPINRDGKVIIFKKVFFLCLSE